MSPVEPEQFAVKVPCNVPVPSKVTVPVDVYSIVPPALPIENARGTFPVPDENFNEAEVLDDPMLKVLLLLPRLLPKLEIISVPLSIEIFFPIPPKVFVFDIVSAFDPDFVKLNAPDIIPLAVISPEPPILASEPRAIVPIHVAAAPEFIKAPPLDTPVPLTVRASVALDVNENPFKSILAPLETTVPAPVVPRGPLKLELLETPSFNVPSLIVVKPVKVLLPDRVKGPPVPVFNKGLFVPEMTDEMVIPPLPSVFKILLVAFAKTRPKVLDPPVVVF